MHASREARRPETQVLALTSSIAVGSMIATKPLVICRSLGGALSFCFFKSGVVLHRHWALLLSIKSVKEESCSRLGYLKVDEQSTTGGEVVIDDTEVLSSLTVLNKDTIFS